MKDSHVHEVVVPAESDERVLNNPHLPLELSCRSSSWWLFQMHHGLPQVYQLFDQLEVVILVHVIWIPLDENINEVKSDFEAYLRVVSRLLQELFHERSFP